MPKESLGKTVDQWERILGATEANEDVRSILARQSRELRGLLKKVRELSKRQAALTALKQQVTRDLQGALDQGREIAAQMRTGLKAQYGFGSEKLTEFGLRPRRRPRRPAASGRKRKENGAPPEE